jgi:hypothetical protein
LIWANDDDILFVFLSYTIKMSINLMYSNPSYGPSGHRYPNGIKCGQLLNKVNSRKMITLDESFAQGIKEL